MARVLRYCRCRVKSSQTLAVLTLPPRQQCSLSCTEPGGVVWGQPWSAQRRHCCRALKRHDRSCLSNLGCETVQEGTLISSTAVVVCVAPTIKDCQGASSSSCPPPTQLNPHVVPVASCHDTCPLSVLVFGTYTDVTPRQFFNVQVKTPSALQRSLPLP